MRALPNPFRMVFILLLAALLSGCGMARMAFNNGESLTWFWLDRYVDFDDQQKQWVRKEIDDIFAWHRRTQLAAYIDTLQQAQRRVQRPVTAEELQADVEMGKQRILAVVDRSLPALAELALSLQPEQIANIEKKFASNNNDYRRDNLRGDIENRQRERYKKALKQAEYFFGSLSTHQEAQLRRLSDARPLNNELVLKWHKRRQAELLTMLRKIHAEKPSKEATVSLLRAYVKGWQDYFGNAEHKAFHQAYQAATLHQVAELTNGATPEQRQHLLRNLQEWIDDFRRRAER